MDLMDVQETSNYLKIPVHSLRVMCSKKVIPYHHIGRRVIFIKSELMDWIVSGKAEKAYTTPGD